MAQVYVSIGSNIDREQNIAASLHVLAELYDGLEQSSVYESDAVGFDSAPFYNLVVGFSTTESPQQVVAQLHAVEDRYGRQRTGMLTARTLDLDLLLYDDCILQAGSLVLPRSDIERYAFVLCPLAEIAGDRPHPVTGLSFADMWSAFPDNGQQLTPIDWPPRTKQPGV